MAPAAGRPCRLPASGTGTASASAAASSSRPPGLQHPRPAPVKCLHSRAPSCSCPASPLPAHLTRVVRVSMGAHCMHDLAEFQRGAHGSAHRTSEDVPARDELRCHSNLLRQRLEHLVLGLLFSLNTEHLHRQSAKFCELFTCLLSRGAPPLRLPSHLDQGLPTLHAAGLRRDPMP